MGKGRAWQALGVDTRRPIPQPGGGLALELEIRSMNSMQSSQSGLVPQGVRSFRRAMQVCRSRLRIWPDPRTIQRTIPLAPEDMTSKRKRWHVLVDLISEKCPDFDVVVVEIGTYQGDTAGHLHKYCPQIRQIYTIDITKPDPERDRISQLDRVKFIHGYSDVCARMFDDESIDLVFIDADHAERSVLRDLDAWVPKVKRRGVISGHDYGSRRHPGVKRAVDRYFSAHHHPPQLEADMTWWTVKERRSPGVPPPITWLNTRRAGDHSGWEGR